MNNSTNTLLNYRVVGNGYPVVFLHGFLESISMWEYLSLSQNNQKILIDLPGHGTSDFTKTTLFSMQSVAKEVKRVIDELNIQEYHLVGHSMGGYIGIELIKIDVRCDKLILLNSNFWEDNEQKKIDRLRISNVVKTNKKLFIYEAIPNLFLDPRANNTEITALIEEAVAINSETIALFSIAMSKRKNNTNFVLKNANRILIIQGKEDPIISSEKMRKSLEECSLKIDLLDNCGHMGHIEKSYDVATAISNWLS
tara:strand:+ start:19812 stop:20573 length:762 start_codon:yes stop_codon:yes gene_type:complete